MPAPTMSEFEDCERRFQAAVDVIQSLPKNGTYKPSYEVMLRFYGLFKQAVCGPCTLSRPGFWDPVGRYKWEAWSNMGEMSRETAMAAYVDEMKKVAQDVIDTMQINEKNASYFHYFEPLYHVIHDMPRPPEALFSLSSDAKQQTGGVFKHEVESATQEPRLQQDTESTLNIELQPQSTGYMAYHSARPLSVAGSGQGDRDHSKCGSGQVQQQIFLALRQLQEDMQSVMERLDVVENLATTNAQNSQWISHLQRTAGESEEKWWTFEISGRTLMLLLVWPFVTQWLSFLLRWRKRQIHGCI
ncbi:acyl-CoA-binding domain-containing protein 4 isoform X3 [Danio aesculapii]|uniref:acyl-CoA-binding domain-containing protein 4 isoform X3 n=1 Tax=Danio aesculapii TaxID=1142201 RepID=UPI0024BFB799|nr:acyl-CoA-binding domain-containing protein 4 isoform X3 [Danio aesculapii]